MVNNFRLHFKFILVFLLLVAYFVLVFTHITFEASVNISFFFEQFKLDVVFVKKLTQIAHYSVAVFYLFFLVLT